MRRQNQIVLARMNRDVAHGERRQVARKLRPLLAAVYRDEQAELGPNEKQVSIHAVFANDVRVTLYRIRRKRLPRLAEVGGLEDVELHVAGLMAVERDVSRRLIKAARLDGRAPGICGKP